MGLPAQNTLSASHPAVSQSLVVASKAPVMHRGCNPNPPGSFLCILCQAGATPTHPRGLPLPGMPFPHKMPYSPPSVIQALNLREPFPDHPPDIKLRLGPAPSPPSSGSALFFFKALTNF